MVYILDRFDKFVEHHSIRSIMLITVIVMYSAAVAVCAVGTYSDEYTIEEVYFTNEKYYHKFEEYGPTIAAALYGPDYENVSLRPDHNKIITISAYVITPSRVPASGKFPTIIWSHGMFVNNEFQLHYALEFAAAGFKVIAMGLTGHGNNGGDWDMGIFDMEMFYSAVDYALSLPDVDPSKIAVCGHSNGGMVAARAGIFDNTPLGTGGYISSVGSIWTVSDFRQSLLELTGNWTDPVNNPGFSWLVPMFMGVPRKYISPEDLMRRAVSDYANATNIKNWFIISGSADQMSSPDVMYNAMASAVPGQVTYSDIKSTVESTLKAKGYGEWNNTALPGISFANGTARKIMIVDGMDHIGEAFSPFVVQQLINWFVISMNLDPSEHVSRMERGINVGVFWALRFIGALISLGATVMLQILFLVFLAVKLFPERARYFVKLSEKEWEERPESHYGGFLPPGLQEYLIEEPPKSNRELFKIFANTWRRKALYFTGLTLCLIGGVWLFFKFEPMPITRAWIFNAYLWQFMFSGLLMIIYGIIVLLMYKRSRYYGPYVSLERVGVSWFGFFRAFAYVGISVFLPLIFYNILAYPMVIPKIWPRPVTSGIWGDFFLAAFMIWVLYLPMEILIKTQLFAIRRDYLTKQGYWLEIIANAFLVFIMWTAAYVIGSFFMSPDLFHLVFLSGKFGGTIFLIINTGMFLLNAVMAFVTALIYQRTRNVFACSLFPTFIWVIILFGKLMGMYSVF